jgi:CheY-like chemotaxis protein
MERYASLWDAPQSVKGPSACSGAGLILVVDDEELVRRAAKAALQRYGYTVLEAENGLQALELFQRMQDSIALVLLDLTMPILSGEDTYRQLKSLKPGLPVIVSSGYDEMEAERRFGGEAGMDFIKKPYVAQKLAQKVQAVLER